jgi:hypothetical protein
MANSTWTGSAGDNNWNTPQNWSAGVPGSGDRATIGGYITINGPLTNIAEIFVSGEGPTLTGDLVTTGLLVTSTVYCIVILSGNISGSGGITKTGPVDLFLSGMNSYLGDTFLNGGNITNGSRLYANNISAFSSGTVIVNGGLLSLDYRAITNPINYVSGQIVFTPSYAGVITLNNATLTIDVDIYHDITGVIAVPVGSTLNLAGKSIPANVRMLGGTLLNYGSYQGTTEVSNGTTFTIPSGGELLGTTIVSPTGKLSVSGRHSGTVNNYGEVIIDLSTAQNPPINIYNGLDGSKYAVRAA